MKVLFTFTATQTLVATAMREVPDGASEEQLKTMADAIYNELDENAFEPVDTDRDSTIVSDAKTYEDLLEY